MLLTSYIHTEYLQQIFTIIQILSTDFEIGHFLRARIIPKAVLYYTGDVVEDDDDDDYDEGV